MDNQIGVGRSRIVTAFAFCLAVLGLAFLFAPQEAGSSILGGHDAGPMASLLGAAMVSMGLMNWIARNSALGGIYGRTVVSGNQAHFMIGSLVLLKHGASAGGPASYWAFTSFYVLGGVFFSSLLFGAGMRPPAAGQK